jgi:sporulation protein YlmC with PRC-barrel domain
MYGKQIKPLTSYFSEVLAENAVQSVVKNAAAAMKVAQLKRGDTVVDTDEAGVAKEFVAKTGNKAVVRDDTGHTETVDVDNIVASDGDDEGDTVGNTPNKPTKPTKPGQNGMNESIHRMRHLAGLL